MTEKFNSDFQDVVKNTYCPFASTARISFGPKWDSQASFEKNIAGNAQSLVAFCKIAQNDKLQGFVMEIRAEHQAQNFEFVKEHFHSTLRELNLNDPDRSSCLTDEISGTKWQFEFAKIRMFLNVFAPCYPESHTKFSYHPDRIFIFFQPEFTFDYCGINRWNQKTKDYIRKLFSDAGRPYNGNLIDNRIEAVLYMFPVGLDDPPVCWWE